MVMPLEPQNAAEELHEAGWRPGAAAVISLATQLAQALEHIHSQGGTPPPSPLAHVWLSQLSSNISLPNQHLSISEL